MADRCVRIAAWQSWLCPYCSNGKQMRPYCSLADAAWQGCALIVAMANRCVLIVAWQMQPGRVGCVLIVAWQGCVLIAARQTDWWFCLRPTCTLYAMGVVK